MHRVCHVHVLYRTWLVNSAFDSVHVRLPFTPRVCQLARSRATTCSTRPLPHRDSTYELSRVEATKVAPDLIVVGIDVSDAISRGPGARKRRGKSGGWLQIFRAAKGNWSFGEGVAA